MQRHCKLCGAIPVFMILIFAAYFFIGAPTAHAATNCASADVPQAQCQALLDLYNSTDGANWGMNTDWGQTNTVCTWFGVNCSGGNVVSLTLQYNNMVGTLPGSLGNLSQLEMIYLTGNSLSGSLPAEIANLTSLIVLDVGENDLSGSIPASIGNLTNLTVLNLGRNNFSGALPSQLGNLVNLVTLQISHEFPNSGPPPFVFTGSLPAGLSNMTQLDILEISNNQFSGTMPVLSPDAPLRMLFAQNAFEKNTVNTFNQCDGYNNGAIGTWLTGAQYPTLEVVNIGNNCFTGDIPDLSGAPIEFLTLSSNPWTVGPIPTWIVNSTTLRSVSMQSAQRTGTLPVLQSPVLEQLSVSNNALTGNIPAGYNGTNFPNLVYFDMYSNNMSGDIPTEIGTLSTMIYFAIQGNNFTSLPESVVTGWTGIANTSFGGKIWLNYNQFDENTMSTALKNFIDANYRPVGAYPNWRNTQTLPPANVQVTGTTADSATLSWTKRGEDIYTARFEVGVSTTDGGPYTFDAANFTANKDTTTLTVNGLNSGTTYYFVVRKSRFFLPNFAPQAISKNSAQVSATPSGSPTEPTNPPTKPQLVSPDNNAVIVGEAPVLVWNVNPAEQQVNRYRVTLLDNLNQVVTAVNVLPATCSSVCELDTATLGITFKNVKYTWQVQARNVKGNSLSDPRAFTMQLPGRPVLLAPVDTNTSPTPTLTWELRGSPSQYRVEIFDNLGVRVLQTTFEAVGLWGCATVGDTCTFVLPNNLPNGTYTWQVIARNPVAYPGLNSKSAVRSFTVFHPYIPTISAPKDSITVNTAKPTMQWIDTSNGANVEYRVIVRKSSDNTVAYQSAWMNKAAVLCDADTDCDFLLPVSLTNGGYKWYLEVRENINGTIYRKRTPGFALFNLLFPDVPVQQSPIGVVVTSPTPTFTWGEVANATEYRIQVRVPVANQIIYNSGWQAGTCSLGTCSFVGTKALTNLVYQWRVEARNSAESTNVTRSPWSNFTLRSPGVASNLAGDINTTLTWDSADSATEYRVQIQSTPTNTAVYSSGWFTCVDLTCSNTPGTVFTTGNYRWRVQARNTNGMSSSAWATQSIP